MDVPGCCRALFGIAMGGEWGLGSSLAMESIPPQARGVVSGILQCGYPTGYLLASVAYGLLYQRSIGDFTVGWRAMFLLSVLPALVVLFIRSHVPESPAFAEAQKAPKPKLIDTLRANWGIALYAVVLMMCFNLFSHGTQDLYPTFLQKQHQFDHTTVSWITIVANLGAIVGGLSVRLRFGEDRPRQRDHDRRAHRVAGAAAVGLFVDARHARDRRVRHADQRPGRLGRHSRPSQ